MNITCVVFEGLQRFTWVHASPSTSLARSQQTCGMVHSKNPINPYTSSLKPVLFVCFFSLAGHLKEYKNRKNVHRTMVAYKFHVTFRWFPRWFISAVRKGFIDATRKSSTCSSFTSASKIRTQPQYKLE